jgi:hypothetical protein
MIDDRSDRERHAEAKRRSDLWLPGTAISSARQLVQVYDGGSLPTAADKVYLTHPAVLDADDTEGATWTGAVDSGVTIPVVVLGSAPDVGDYLVAHAVGGRWFARSNGRTLFCTSSCSPWAIPKSSLTATWTSGTGPGEWPAGSGTLSYRPGGFSGFLGGVFAGPTWALVNTTTIGTNGEQRTNIFVSCYGGQTVVAIQGMTYNTFFGWAAVCDAIILNYDFGFSVPCTRNLGLDLSLQSSALNPYNLEYDVINGPYNANATKYYGTLTIDGPVEAAFSDVGFKCCYPSPIPRADLTLTIGASSYTLAYDPGDANWSDGVYTLACGSGFVSLTGPGTWSLSLSDSVGDPLHLKFTGTSTAYVDE